MGNLTKLKYDLIIGFGFSETNADEAIRMWHWGELSDKESDILYSLFQNSPFKHPPRGINERTITESKIKRLNKLNFRISNK